MNSFLARLPSKLVVRVQKNEDWLVRLFILSFVVILVLLPLHAFLSTWLGTTIGPLLVWKSWKEILLLGLLPFLVFYFWLRPNILQILWKRRINQIIVAYVLLHLVLSVFSHVSRGAIVAGLLINLRFLAMFLLAQLLIETKHPWVISLKAFLPKWLLWTTLVLSILAIAQVTVIPRDFLSHFGYNKDKTIAPYELVDQNPQALRAFATMRGPNTLGAFLILPLLMAVYLIVKRREVYLSGAVLATGSVALLATGSRSAWLGFALGLLILLVGLLPRSKLRWLWWAMPVLGVGGLLLLWLATVNPNIRLAVFHSRVGRTSLITGSSEQHVSSVVENAKDALAHPLGQGPGAAGPASYYDPGGTQIGEDYFVQIAQEVGLLGLAIFLAINILLARQLLRDNEDILPRVLIASLAGLTLLNIFLHGWADDPTAMTWWGIAGLYYKGLTSNSTSRPKRPRSDARAL
ncbi:MAG TPA: hypothetical protein VNX65_04760 [Patescibacteria group bacterium]|jgi:hypothetical protein|nr:hypothetical protein [Patescibacteria group bacterium]